MTGEFLSVQKEVWCTPLSHPSSCMLVNHGPSQHSSKKEYKPWKWGANARYYTLIQRPCYQQGSPCQDPAGNRITRRPPNHCKETQTAVVESCLLFIRPGQNHLAGHRKRGKKTRQTEEKLGIQHQEMDRPGVCKVPEGSEEQRKMEETGVKSITLTVKGKIRWERDWMFIQE